VKILDLFDLQLVVIISKEKSLSAVSSRMGINAPSVSKRLAKIEDIIGHKIVRRPGPFRLTPSGERLRKFAENTLAEHQRALDDIHDMATNQRQLRIIANPSVVINDLPNVIAAMKRKYPALNIHITEGNFAKVIADVQTGAVDIGLIADAPKVKGLRFLRYKKDYLSVMTPAGHPLEQLRTVSLSDVLPYPLIGADGTRHVSTFIARAARQEKYEITYALSVSSYEVQAHLVATTNIGIALMIESIAQRFARNHDITIKRLSDEWAHTDFSACVRDVGTISDITREFIELLVKQHQE